MSNQFLFEDALPTPLTNYASVITFAQFMRPQQQFVVCQLIAAFTIIALKSDLVQVLVFKLVHGLERCLSRAFAWSREKLR